MIFFYFMFLVYLLKMCNIIFCDAARPWQLSFQDPATKIAEGMYTFHNCIMTYLVGITIFVVFMLYTIIVKFRYDPSNNKKASNFVKFLSLEIWYIVIPTYILYCIAVPSFLLLYALDDISSSAYHNVKVVGHQWYWTYEIYEDLKDYSLRRNFVFDSYMLETDSLNLGDLRLLEVDHSLYLPVDKDIKLLVTSMDVLHCWAVPSFGIKVDACPGRLTKAILNVKREGVFYGQCSEICGTNHGFMPIRVMVVDLSTYYSWLFCQNGDYTANGLTKKIESFRDFI